MFYWNLLALFSLVLIFLFGPKILRLRKRPNLPIVTSSYFFGQLWIYLWTTIFKIPVPLFILAGLAGFALISKTIERIDKEYDDDKKHNLFIATTGYVFGPLWLYFWKNLLTGSVILMSMTGAVLLALLTLMSFKFSINYAHRPYQGLAAAAFHATFAFISIVLLGISCWAF